MKSKSTCPLCNQAQWTNPVSNHHRFVFCSGCACQNYYVNEIELATHVPELDGEIRRRIPALLLERHLKKLPIPVLMFGDRNKPELPFGPVLQIDEFLADWPETIPERIDRSLCNLARAFPKPGVPAKLQFGEQCDYFLFTSNEQEALFYLRYMIDQKWVKRLHPREVDIIRITVEGWARVGELSKGIDRHLNPVFVAMWFGGKIVSDRERMTRRFEDFIRVAANASGWKAERVDSAEHNDSIMDRIVSMIQVAPFVIADLTQNNAGVYYEAGFARGQKIPVIYVVEEGVEPHFDVSGVNHVRWSTEDELRKRLENRILGTIGRGLQTVG